ALPEAERINFGTKIYGTIIYGTKQVCYAGGMTFDRSMVDQLRQTPLPQLVSIAGNVLNSRWNALLSQEHGVSTAGMNVLMALSRGPGTHTEIARRCWVHVSTLTGIVDTLARDRLVERQRDTADRRKVLLVLTPQGRKITERVGS